MPADHRTGFVRLIGSNVVTKVTWALSLIVLLRGLGSTDFGYLVVIWSISGLAFALSDLGTSQVLLRDGARNRELTRALAGKVFRLQVLLTGLIVAAVSATLWLLPGLSGLGQHDKPFVIVANVLAIAIDRFQVFFTVLGQLVGNYRIYAGTRSAYFLVLLIVFVIQRYEGMNLIGCSIAYLLVTVLAGVLMGGLSWRFLLPLPGIGMADKDIAAWRDLLKSGVPFFGVMAMTLAYGRIEVAALGAWGNPEQAGLFHFDYQIILLGYSLSGIFFTVIFPHLYRRRGDRVALEADYLESGRWLGLFAWMIAPPLMLFAPDLLRLVGNAYVVSQTEVLRALVSLLLLIPGAATLNFLMASDLLKQRLGCEAIGVGISVIGTVYAALHGSALYAAYSASIGYAATVVFASRVVHMHLGFRPLILTRESLRFAVLALPTAMMVWLLPLDWWLGMPAYLVTMTLLLVLTRHPLVARVRSWWPGMSTGKVLR